MNVSRLQNRTSLLRLLLGDVEKKEQAPNDDDTSPDVMVNLASHQQWLKDGLLQKTVMKQLYYIKPLHSSKKFWFVVWTMTTVFFNLQTFKNCLHLVFESDRFGRLYLGSKNCKIAKTCKLFAINYLELVTLSIYQCRSYVCSILMS